MSFTIGFLERAKLAKVQILSHLTQLCMKNYSSKIKPRRYVYHLTYSENREFIVRKGLVASSRDGALSYKNAVFAHNTNKITEYWYPYILDQYDIMFGMIKEIVNLMNFGSWLEQDFVTMKYDIWRIDTHALNRNWFLDNVAGRDFLKGINYPYYVMSYGDIPPSALMLVDLFQPYDIEMVENEVAHIVPHFK